MYLMTLVKNINNTFKIKKECSNHLVSNQADFSLEALKSCFIYKYGRNKTKKHCIKPESQNIARTRGKKNPGS